MGALGPVAHSALQEKNKKNVCFETIGAMGTRNILIRLRKRYFQLKNNEASGGVKMRTNDFFRDIGVPGRVTVLQILSRPK